MDTIQPQDPSELPDLPELTDIDAKAEGTGPLSILFTLFIVLLVPGFATPLTAYGVITCGNEIATDTTGLVILVALLLLLVLFDYWILNKVIQQEHRWRTGNNGLTVYKLFHKRYVAWHEVDDVDLAAGRFKGLRLVMKLKSGKSFVLSGEALKNIVLYLSIRQHLKQVDKADKLLLPLNALWLWHSVPEEVMTEMTWENPDPPRLYTVLVEMLTPMSVAAIISYYIVFIKHIEAGLLIFTLVSGITIGIAWAKLTVFRSFEMDEDTFTAQTVWGTVSMPWDQVQSIGFGITGWITIKLNRWRTISIPWYPKHPNSTRLILAVIRRLRKEEHLGPIPIPTVLLVAMEDGGAALWNAS